MGNRPRGVKGCPRKMRAGRYRYRGYFIRRYGKFWKIEGEPQGEWAKLGQVLDAIDARGLY
jgi:hypothetical protein